MIHTFDFFFTNIYTFTFYRVWGGRFASDMISTYSSENFILK